MIKFKDVGKWYHNNTLKALDNINIDIQSGEFVFLHGHSGSGKTTFLHLIFREIIPTKGEIFVDKVKISDLPDKKIPLLRRKIGVVFQDFKLLYNKTSFHNIYYVMRVSGTSKKDAIVKTEQILKDVGLWYKRDAYPHYLSAGEQQRLSIARALVANPSIILADEPTGNLDFENSLNVLELLKNINLKGATVIMATHNLQLLQRHNKARTIKLSEGRLES